MSLESFAAPAADRTGEKLASWCSASGMSFESPEAEEAYKARTRRITDAIRLAVPDRVPIAPLVTFFPARRAGMTTQEAMYDHERAYQAYKQTALAYRWDTAFGHNFALPGPVFDALEYKQLKWPGHGVPPDRPYQFVEAEYMKADEYDAFLDDPSDFLIRSYLPRACGALAPFENLPSLRLTVPYYLGVLFMTGESGMAGTTSAFKAIAKAQSAFLRFVTTVTGFAEELQTLGYPAQFGGFTQAPYDTLGDSLRGTQGIMLDMYRRPEKLLKAMDKLLPAAIQMGVRTSVLSPSPIVFIPLHKGAMGFMSRKQFETFYWPTLYELMMGLIEEGLVPMPLFEADYTDRLDLIRDIPRGKAVYWFERTDIFRAKEVLGDRVCLKGNVASSLLCTGSPDEVRQYCKKLIDVAGKGGGLIVDGDIGIPDEARPENVQAMTDFTKEYGVYRAG